MRRSNDYQSLKEKPSSNISYRDLSIDKEKCCVFKDGKPIELGAKEYKLLLYFMENPERVFTKTALSAVWDEDYYFDDNTIMVQHQPYEAALRMIRRIQYQNHSRYRV